MTIQKKSVALKCVSTNSPTWRNLPWFSRGDIPLRTSPTPGSPCVAFYLKWNTSVKCHHSSVHHASSSVIEQITHQEMQLPFCLGAFLSLQEGSTIHPSLFQAVLFLNTQIQAQRETTQLLSSYWTSAFRSIFPSIPLLKHSLQQPISVQHLTLSSREG